MEVGPIKSFPTELEGEVRPDDREEYRRLELSERQRSANLSRLLNCRSAEQKRAKEILESKYSLTPRKLTH